MHNNSLFRDLIVLDMANNHQGDVEHGLHIIREMARLAEKHELKVAIKFQFRNLETLIHKDHRKESNNKNIDRFLSTRLGLSDFKRMVALAAELGLQTMCTPFDELSVNDVVELGFDFIKVASCSADDWPLLEAVAKSNLPIIFSTGGLITSEIDDLVSFFDHRGCDYAIMHCVSIYPTPSSACQLNYIDNLRTRYPSKVVGWSTHEAPDEVLPVSIAIAKGARMFERHVGVPTEKYKLNAYSSNPSQIDLWFENIKKSYEICGLNEKIIDKNELNALKALKRGVYLNKNVKIGEILTNEDVYYAMPLIEGQLTAGEFKNGTTCRASIKTDEPLMRSTVTLPALMRSEILKHAIHEVKAMLAEAKIHLNSEFEVEYSHHYGVEAFREYGAVLINVINRSYCKKIIVQLPGQKHPAHFHKLKEESFQILSGELELYIDGRKKVLGPGDVALVMPGVWHSFSTKSGCIFEEVSTTHFNNDSIYKDDVINQKSRGGRKTRVNHWGRWEVPLAVNSDSSPVV